MTLIDLEASRYFLASSRLITAGLFVLAAVGTVVLIPTHTPPGGCRMTERSRARPVTLAGQALTRRSMPAYPARGKCPVNVL